MVLPQPISSENRVRVKNVREMVSGQAHYHLVSYLCHHKAVAAPVLTVTQIFHSSELFTYAQVYTNHILHNLATVCTLLFLTHTTANQNPLKEHINWASWTSSKHTPLPRAPHNWFGNLCTTCSPQHATTAAVRSSPQVQQQGLWLWNWLWLSFLVLNVSCMHPISQSSTTSSGASTAFCSTPVPTKSSQFHWSYNLYIGILQWFHYTVAL